MLITQRVFWTTAEKQQKASRICSYTEGVGSILSVSPNSPVQSSLMPGEIPSGSIHPMRKRGAQGPRQGSPLQVYSLLLLRSPTVSSAQSSRSVVSNPGTPWTAAPQASLSFTNSRSLLKLMSIKLVMPSNHLSLCRPFSSCLQSSLASGSFLMSQVFVSGSQGVGASASTSILPMNFQDWFPLGWLVWSPCSPRDSQE